MKSSVSFTTLSVGLALGVSALAQAPPPGGPQQNPPLAQAGTGSSVTQSSRIRAFNPGPDGQLRSLYLSNGSVVNLPPDLGRTMRAVKKGERVRVSGTRSTVNGQTILSATSVTLHGQIFLSQPGSSLIAREHRLALPPPPAGSPERGPDPGGNSDVARERPLGPGAERPQIAQAPPPPPSPDGPARPRRNQPPPPPPNGGSRVNAPPPPPIDPKIPVQQNTLPTPPADQPLAPTSPTAQPLPGGPAL